MHCFVQSWQHLQLDNLKGNRKPHEVLIEQDFAEAYVMNTKNSAMSTYWSDQTLNIHVTVVDRDVGSLEVQFVPEGEVY